MRRGGAQRRDLSTATAVTAAAVLAVLTAPAGGALATPAVAVPPTRATSTPARATPAVAVPAGTSRGTSTPAPTPGSAAGARAARARRTDATPSGLPGPGLHWVLRSGQSSLVVDLVDASGPAWPVRAAARSWRTPEARFVLSAACRADVPCVLVTERAVGRTGWTGATTARPGEMFSFTSPVRITLNDSYPLTAAQRQAIACHELGHALGLSHDDRATSCMRPAPVALDPDRADLAALAALYPPEGALSRRR